jgi:hypothetical protein
MYVWPTVRSIPFWPYLLYTLAAVALWLFGLLILSVALVGALSMLMLNRAKRFGLGRTIAASHCL